MKIFSEKEMDPENLNVIEWGVVDQELARLCSLSSALNETKEKKRSLQRKLESLIQVGFWALLNSVSLDFVLNFVVFIGEEMYVMVEGGSMI